jgi:deoxyadenosine/deoxycytidine kinase
MQGRVCIVEGLIGAGKSSFTQELGRALGEGTLVLMEPDEKNGANPYLEDFYGDQSRWSYTMQTHLLHTRFRMHLNAQWHVLSGAGDAVLDRSYFGDTAFARLQRKRGTMTPREYGTYQGLYQAMTASVLLPTMCVVLEVDPEVAAERIQRRLEAREGRRCEKAIDLGYLCDLKDEIDRMVSVLEGQGVHILRLDWNRDRPDEASRRDSVGVITESLLESPPRDIFGLHGRTM